MQTGEKQEMTMSDFFALSQDEGGIYEIETPSGWVEIGDLYKKNNKKCYILRTKEGKELGASDDHLIKTTNDWKGIEEIDVNDCFVITKDGTEEVIAIESIGIRDTYDLEVKSNEHAYYSNSIVSHNTGKTTLGWILCSNLPKHSVLWVTPDMIKESGVGGKFAIGKIYKLAEYLAPCVMILEDIDLFAEDREGVVDGLNLGGLMNLLDGVNNVKNIITIATTNRLQMIEKALRNRPGRFDRVVEIVDMSSELRKMMLINRLQGYSVEDNIIDYIVSKTKRYNGAEVQELINSISLHFIDLQSDVEKPVITTDIIDSAIKQMHSFGVIGGAGEDGKKAMGFGTEMDDA